MIATPSKKPASSPKKNEGSKITAVTFGAAAKNSLKDVLSRGPDQVVWSGDAAANTADGFVTANVLSALLKKLEGYDLILCGEGSADVYAQQTGPRIAVLLGIPAVTFVKELRIEGNQIIAVRKLGNCTETVTAPFPALVTLLPEINKPRIPGLKQVLARGKETADRVQGRRSRTRPGGTVAQNPCQRNPRLCDEPQECSLERRFSSRTSKRTVGGADKRRRSGIGGGIRHVLYLDIF